MAEVQASDDSADSRTAIVGQKRGYQESSLSSAAANHDSSSARGGKRAKLDHDGSEGEPFTKDGDVNGSLSGQNVSPDEIGTQQALGSTSLPAAAAPTMAWNKGIQTGLRTSFASRLKTKVQSTRDGTTLTSESKEVVLPFDGLITQPPTTHANSSSDDSDISAESDAPEVPSLGKRSSRTKLSASLPQQPKKELSKKAAIKLAKKEKRQRNNALKAIIRAEDKGPATAEAIELFKGMPYPWPGEYKELKLKMRDGRTYYPSIKPSQKKKMRAFQSQNLELAIPEILENNRPIRIQDLNYDRFVPHLVRNNQKQWALLTRTHVVECFYAYIKMCYPHLGQFYDTVRKTAEVEDAISIEEAIQLVTHELDTSGAALVAPPGYDTTRDKLKGEDAVSQTLGEAQVQSLESSQHAPIHASPAAQNEAHQNPKVHPVTEVSGVPNHPRILSQLGSTSDKHSQFIGIGKSNPPQESSARDLLNAGSAAQDNTVRSETSHEQTRKIPIAHDSSENKQDVKHLDNGSAAKQLMMSVIPEVKLMLPGTEANMTDTESTNAELVLQQKYFPAVNPHTAVPHCLACADAGHPTNNCPALVCTVCGDVGHHSSFTCPQRQKCGKCRQRGHRTSECREKLLPAKSELLGCEICTGGDHIETSCHFIWRSYAPKPDDIRRVRSIAVHCYSCGASGHYGPACGLSPATRILSGGITWSEENLYKYVDVHSEERAVSAGTDFSIQPKKNRPSRSVSIKGRANNPITIDESGDDDGTSFIRPKVDQPGVRHRNIQFSGDIRSGQEPPVFSQSVPSRAPMPGQHRQMESSRYGRERSFSPPPRFGDSNYHNFPHERRNRPDSPAEWREEYSYRPAAVPTYSFPLDNRASIVGGNGRGGRIAMNYDIERYLGASGNGGGRGPSLAATRSGKAREVKPANKNMSNAPKAADISGLGKGDNKKKPRITKQDRAHMASEKAAKGARRR